MRGCCAFFALLLVGVAADVVPAADAYPNLQLFVDAASQDEGTAEAAMTALAESWRDDYTALLVDFARFMRPRRRARAAIGAGTAGAATGSTTGGAPGAAGSGGFPTAGTPQREDPSTRVRERLTRFLEDQTGQDFGDDLRAWRRWYWRRPYNPHPEYAAFKAALYSNVDERMGQFFTAGGPERIRLDEIDWGGVSVNGIPPLDHPEPIPAEQAGYLEDKHVVFGIEVGGEARAYPKRILAWHEMALDRLGGTELTIVYCTLCGTVIPYGSEAGGEHHTFGTSGLLYRSNKLMFDHETMSLWSTIEGRPVIGPLATRYEDLELQAYPVVTTTWREWKALHPDTTVLSLDTGYERDYSEGAAYRSYFRTDRLMFGVPKLDKRLKNKEPVLALRLRPAGGRDEAGLQALALSARFLKKKQNRVFHKPFAGHELVIVTSRDGANRVYDAGATRFVGEERDGRLRDATGGYWRLTETALVSEAGGPSPRPRLPARRVFWFAWQAMFPDTELVK
jgi:hypothetical protein